MQYRDIAPEGVDDETILSLIQKSAGSHTAITAAIENMWHGELLWEAAENIVVTYATIMI